MTVCEHIISLKKNSFSVRALPLFLFFILTTTSQAQDNAKLVIKGQTLACSRKGGLGLNAGVKSVDYKEEPLEGVEIEVKKNGTTIAQATSGKKGKYSFEIPVSTTDAKNDYVVYISKSGMGPRMVSINSFLPKEEYKKYTLPSYECELNVLLYFTTVTDISLEKFTEKIKWDNAKEHKFMVDAAYARGVLGDDQKIKANPDLFYTSLVKKKKKTEEALAKKNAAADAAKQKADALAKQKADEEAQRLAAIKAKEEADRIQREKDELARQELLKKHIADSLAVVAAAKKKTEGTSTASVEVAEIVTPSRDDKEESKDRYDAADTYSIHIARRTLSMAKERRSREKGKNLSAKYETFNILTSLLDMVDEIDKKNKQQ